MNKFLITLIFTIATSFLFGQQKLPVFFIAQAGTAKFKNSDWAPDLSLTAGTRIKRHFGVGANLQAIKFKNDKSLFVPVAAEFLFMNDSRKFGPFINFQIGKTFYSKSLKLIAESGPMQIDTHGGLFVSPGAGILLPFTNNTKAILTFSYMNSAIVTEIKETVPGGFINNRNRKSMEGLRIVLGIKF